MKNTRLVNYVCAIMLVLVFATQFLPFWNCTVDCKDHKDVEKTVSIAEYVWLPDHHKPITKGMTDVYMEAYGEDYTRENGKKFKFELNDIVAPLVVMFAGSIVGAALCVMYSKTIIIRLRMMRGNSFNHRIDTQRKFVGSYGNSFDSFDISHPSCTKLL